MPSLASQKNVRSSVDDDPLDLLHPDASGDTHGRVVRLVYDSDDSISS